MSSRDSELVFGELHYEKRVVSFFDTLGWRNQIETAGNDPREIARLAALPRIFCQTVTSLANRTEGAQITSFSDNVIISTPYDEQTIFSSLQGMSKIILGAATMGFFVRGALTIGNLIHDDQIVFGPALNRAYELESKRAIYPRTVLDPLISDFQALKADFISSDSELLFLQPFNFEFIRRAIAENEPDSGMIKKYKDISNFSAPVATDVPAPALFDLILRRVVAAQESAPDERVREKYSWLLQQIQNPQRSSV